MGTNDAQKQRKKVAKKKHAVGRPTKYREKYCDISDYLQECEEQDQVPLICGLAVRLETSEKIIHDWGNKHPAFRKSLDKIKAIQKQRLISNGLDNTYNSTIAKLILSANHGMSEKTLQEHTGKDGGPVQIMTFGGPDDSK